MIGSLCLPTTSWLLMGNKATGNKAMILSSQGKIASALRPLLPRIGAACTVHLRGRRCTDAVRAAACGHKRHIHPTNRATFALGLRQHITTRMNACVEHSSCTCARKTPIWMCVRASLPKWLHAWGRPLAERGAAELAGPPRGMQITPDLRWICVSASPPRWMSAWGTACPPARPGAALHGP